jgi:hypothetical protein
MSLKFKGANAQCFEIEDKGYINYTIDKISFHKGPYCLDTAVTLVWPTCGCKVELATYVWVQSNDRYEEVLSRIGESVFNIFNEYWENFRGKCPVCEACNYELDFQCDMPNNDYEMWQREEIENSLGGSKAITGRIFLGKDKPIYTYQSNVPLSFDDIQDWSLGGYTKKKRGV